MCLKFNTMKRVLQFTAVVVIVILSSSCRKCYDCARGSDVIVVCSDSKRASKSDISIYEDNGYTCRKR